jgi:hypothetical protein
MGGGRVRAAGRSQRHAAWTAGRAVRRGRRRAVPAGRPQDLPAKNRERLPMEIGSGGIGYLLADRQGRGRRGLL